MDDHPDADWIKPMTPPPPGFGSELDALEHPKTPPPPGFRESDGMQLREALGGSTSAPPPPGYNSGMDQRKSLVSELLLQDEVYSKAHSDTGGPRHDDFDLGDMLGTGLAESIDHNPHEWRSTSDHELTKQSRRSFNDTSFDPAQDISFARMSRHAASRLIGTSPSHANDSLGLDVGGAPAPSTLLSTALEFKPSNHHHHDSKGSDILIGGAASTSSKHKVHAANLSSFGLYGASDAASAKSDGGLLQHHRLSHQPARRSSFGEPLIDRGRQQQQQQQQQLQLDRFSNNSKDVGLTVMEPQEYSRGHGSYANVRGGSVGHGSVGRGSAARGRQVNSYRDDKDVNEIEQEMRGLWVGGDECRSAVSHLDQSIGGNSSVGSAGSLENDRKAERDLEPFMWESRHAEPSRTIVILRATGLHVSDVRTTCEAFGVIETFRPDFINNRGIVFVGYYDIRSSQFAATELRGVLKQLAQAEGLIHNDIIVKFCVPLNSSTQYDESRIVLSDVPTHVDDNSLASMLSSYGSVRTLTRHGGHYGGCSYEVEYHNVQDAKQALLELASSQPWGTNVAVEEAMRAPVDRKRGRELLALIGRWRHGHGKSQLNLPTHTEIPHTSARGANSSTSSSTYPAAPTEIRSADPRGNQPTQLMLGPDGRYSVVLNQPPPPSGYPPYGQPPPPHSMEPRQQQIIHGPQGVTYITSVPNPPSHHSYHNPHMYWHHPHQPPPPPPNHYSYPGTTVVTTSNPYEMNRGGAYINDGSSGVPYYTHVVTSPSESHGGPSHSSNHHHSSKGSVSHESHASASVSDDKDNKHLLLDLDAVENGRDARTSLMVRNIPNKYSQQMLLNEFTENGLGPGVIDFFYLPIDFKNRCNRGYAFINFVDFKDILPFHRRYFGKHWSTFNSDKICDMTYARIQGKAAMLKRFENSALMEKDEEYKPLVFVSNGPEKGKRLPFPEPSKP